MRPEVRYLAFHPGIAIFVLNMRPHRRHQIADRPNAAIGRFETESKLIGGGHWSEVYNRGMQLLALKPVVSREAAKE
jgi:hypothetical protein